ncbi:hypothetical protein C8R45DRAFT_935511 [Mycena sanguinolenta]|nr:hypothetical protein C8R45DRAFT_935511 [Mycena sanguinolenta]
MCKTTCMLLARFFTSSLISLLRAHSVHEPSRANMDPLMHQQQLKLDIVAENSSLVSSKVVGLRLCTAIGFLRPNTSFSATSFGGSFPGPTSLPITAILATTIEIKSRQSLIPPQNGLVINIKTCFAPLKLAEETSRFPFCFKLDGSSAPGQARPASPNAIILDNNAVPTPSHKSETTYNPPREPAEIWFLKKPYGIGSAMMWQSFAT